MGLTFICHEMELLRPHVYCFAPLVQSNWGAQPQDFITQLWICKQPSLLQDPDSWENVHLSHLFVSINENSSQPENQVHCFIPRKDWFLMTQVLIKLCCIPQLSQGLIRIYCVIISFVWEDWNIWGTELQHVSPHLGVWNGTILLQAYHLSEN